METKLSFDEISDAAITKTGNGNGQSLIGRPSADPTESPALPRHISLKVPPSLSRPVSLKVPPSLSPPVYESPANSLWERREWG